MSATASALVPLQRLIVLLGRWQEGLTRGRQGRGGGGAGWSQLVVELVLVSQVDPAEDECGQGQSEHHYEDHRARVAFVPR